MLGSALSMQMFSKTIFIITFNIFFICACFAQETIDRKNRLTDSVIERFQVLKTNREIKNGIYSAYFRRKTVVATGIYTDGVRTGVWNFYDHNGKLKQTYNYDDKSLRFLSPLDTTDDLHYRFDSKIKSTDTVTRPFKIGETYFGYIPYISIFQLPFETFGIDTDQFIAEVELLISPLGVLADYKVHVLSAAYQYDHTVDLDVKLFNKDDRYFVPATVNKQPIVSSIFIKCTVNPDGSLDFY